MRELGIVLLALAWIAAAGCTKSGGDAEKTGSRAADVKFVEASEGLPTEGQWREAVAIGDLDGDGKPEIVAPPSRADAKARPMIWSRKGDRWVDWEAKLPEWPYRYGDVEIADFDKDGKPDLAFGSHATGIAVVLNGGDGRWTLSNEGLPALETFWTRGIATGDFDGDGWVDLAAIAEVSHPMPTNPLGVRIYKNVEGKRWEERRIAPLDRAHGAALSAADLDGDGRSELLLGSLESAITDIVWTRAKGGWKVIGGGLSTPRIYWNVATCRDGEDAPSTLYVAEDAFGPDAPIGPRVYALEDGKWVSRSEGLPPMRAVGLAAADFDRDGRCEIATEDIDENVLTIFRRGDDGAWKQWKAFPRPEGIGGHIFSITAKDLDGDGHPDLAANYASPEGFGGIRAWFIRP